MNEELLNIHMSPKETPCSFAHYTWEPVNIFICARKFSKYQRNDNNSNDNRHKNLDNSHKKLNNEHEQIIQRKCLMLQQARMRTGLTQKQLARIVNLNWTIIRDVENGKENVQSHHIEQICRALNVS